MVNMKHKESFYTTPCVEKAIKELLEKFPENFNSKSEVIRASIIRTYNHFLEVKDNGKTRIIQNETNTRREKLIY